MKQVAVRIRNHYVYHLRKVNHNIIEYRLPIELPPMFNNICNSTPITTSNIYKWSLIFKLPINERKGFK